MTSKPFIRKHGNVWKVWIGDHAYAAMPTHAKAWERAQAIHHRAAHTRMTRDIKRIQEALNRMEAG